jgi:hypothetical protein
MSKTRVAPIRHRARPGDRPAFQPRPFRGREDELCLFRSALCASPDGSVLYVHGLGGVGKSALLRECTGIAMQAGLETVLLDGRLVDPSPGGFLLALRDVLALGATDSPVACLRERGRPVLMLDSYELLAPLDAWFRQTFLPQLLPGVVVVIAGRHPPREWTTDPRWGPIFRPIPLKNLRADESRALLAERRVPETQHSAILEFTHGHPLALVLVADVIASAGPDLAFSPAAAPDVVYALLERFVAGVPTVTHRRALELCAHVRVTTEGLIGALVEGGDPHELFEWLRRLSFMEMGPEGLFPHDVVREALDAEFRWRDAEAYSAMHRRLWLHLRDRLSNSTGRAQQRAFFDKLYLHRANLVGARYHDYGTLGSIFAEPATEDDHVFIAGAVRHHEGDASARIVEHWLRRQPYGFHVIRGAGNGLVGFVATLAVHDPSPEDMDVDPAVRAAWEFARRRGPLRSGDEMLHHRFHMACDVYQEVSPTINLLATMVTVAPLQRSRLAWSFITFAEPERWLPIMRYIRFERADEATFAVGGRRYAVFAHDWRIETFDTWWEREAERSLAGEDEPELVVGPNPAPLTVLSESEFAESVRRALRDYADRTALSSNPLLRARVVRDAAGDAATVVSLQAILREAVEHLGKAERDRKFYRALFLTYIQRAPSQERAAERLGVAFGTYRYHLARGIERVVALLWQRELHGRTTASS